MVSRINSVHKIVQCPALDLHYPMTCQKIPATVVFWGEVTRAGRGTYRGTVSHPRLRPFVVELGATTGRSRKSLASEILDVESWGSWCFNGNWELGGFSTQPRFNLHRFKTTLGSFSLPKICNPQFVAYPVCWPKTTMITPLKFKMGTPICDTSKEVSFPDPIFWHPIPSISRAYPGKLKKWWSLENPRLLRKNHLHYGFMMKTLILFFLATLAATFGPWKLWWFTGAKLHLVPLGHNPITIFQEHPA